MEDKKEDVKEIEVAEQQSENSEPLTEEELTEVNKLTPEQEENQRLQKEQFEADLANSSLYKTIIEAMEVLEFKETSIEDFKNSRFYKLAEEADWFTQRNEFILYVQRKFALSRLLVFVDGEYVLTESVSNEVAKNPDNIVPNVPINIRYSLVVNQSIQLWLADVVAGILPFLHANEALYFDAVNTIPSGEIKLEVKEESEVQ